MGRQKPKTIPEKVIQRIELLKGIIGAMAPLAVPVYTPPPTWYNPGSYITYTTIGTSTTTNAITTYLTPALENKSIVQKAQELTELCITELNSYYEIYK